MHLLDAASLLTAFVASTTGSFLLLRRGSAMSTKVLAVAMLSGSAWAVLGLLALHTDQPDVVASLNRVIVVVAAVQATCGAWFCLTLAGHRLGPRLARAAAVEPLLMVLAGLTDPWTGSVVTDASIGPGSVSLDFGWVFWVHTAYCYALLLTGAGALLRAATRAVPGHRLHYLLGVVAMAPPVLGNVVSTLGAQGGQRDLTAPAFVVTALLWLWVDRGSGRFRSAPITTPQVLRALTDGVLVIDAAGRLVDANPAALYLLFGRDGAPADVVGSHWRDVADADLVAAVTGGTAGAGEPGSTDATGDTGDTGASGGIMVRPDGTIIDLRITPVLVGEQPSGWVVVVRDITEVERLRRELAEQAVRDGLTGLHNRRHLERELAAAVEGETRLSVAVVDIDHFKAVNDRFGHPVGDRVLMAVADALALGADEGDVVARLGGEEFVIVLRGRTASQAVARVEVLRDRCAEAQVPVPGGHVGVTVSAGVAQRRPGHDAGALLAAADAALYEAKAAGRDRTVLAGTDRVAAPVAAVPAPR